MLFSGDRGCFVFVDKTACKATSLECGRENNDQKACITCPTIPHRGQRLIKKMFSFSLKLNTCILAGGCKHKANSPVF